MLYKRIASARNREEIDDLQVELIDRFGLLPQPAKNFMRIAGMKLGARALGIEKIDASTAGGYIQFGKRTAVNPMALVQLVQGNGETYRLRGADRLQYRLAMPGDEDRFEFVERLLSGLVEDKPLSRAANG
jgi:transcription-repair coupling factor (superfamily II helicase)